MLKASAGGAIPVAAARAGQPPAALDVFTAHGHVFGILDAGTQLVETRVELDTFGWTHTSFQQVHHGVPVFSGLLHVHQNAAGEVICVNGRYYPVSDKLAVAPALSSDAAEATARAILGANGSAPTVEENQLVVVDPGWYGDPPAGARLAWHLVLRDDEQGYREGFFIDAADGEILDRWNMITDAMNREVYDASGGGLPGVLARAEGGPPVDPEVDRAYDYSGDTYLYFLRGFGRDGMNGQGMTLISSVRRTFSCPNASWNGVQTSYCDGLAVDDVIAHEFTHGLTQFTANLIYQNQSGQLNESFSDVFGEMVDQFNGNAAFVGDPGGTAWLPAPPSGSGVDTPNNLRTACSPGFDYVDGVRWLVGEDMTVFANGAIRDMWQPPCRNHPDYANSELQTCNPLDAGGVHSGSGVPNHAFAILTDGKTFNGHVVTGIGPIKAGAFWYRALAFYLTPASDFEDAYFALLQAGQDLIGEDPADPRTGAPSGAPIFADDVAQLTTALVAVEMNTPGACGSADDVLISEAPITCDSPSIIFADDFESGPGGWTVSNTAPPTPYDWVLTTDPLPFGRAGIARFCADAAVGDCNTIDESAVHSLFSPVIVTPVSDGVLFASYTHFLQSEGGWDAGNIKISVEGGPWQVIPRGAFRFNPFNGRINSIGQGNTNPLAGEPGWTGTGGQWGTSVIDLGTLASPGDDVQFRFDFGKDGCTGGTGWYVDDFALFTCADCNDDAQIDIDGYFLARAFDPAGNIGAGMPQAFVVTDPPVVSGDVILSFYARGDFSSAEEFLDVDINGAPAGRVYELSSTDCGGTPEFQVLAVPEATWNSAAGGGSITINVVASPEVNGNIGGSCFGETYVSVFIRAAIAADDCSGNRTPDSCDAAAADIATFVADMLDGGEFACYFDFNQDDALDGADIQHYVDALLAP